MDKIKSLLLPLALVFGAIAVFEFGARYGAANMRAFAIVGELQLPLKIYAQGQSKLDPASKEAFAMLIDNGLAAGALQRDLWYVSKESKAALDKALQVGLSMRGDATIERFKSAESAEDFPPMTKARVAEILAALEKAKVDLIDNAPTPAEPSPETETAAAE